MNDLYDSGYDRADWYALKRACLNVESAVQDWKGDTCLVDQALGARILEQVPRHLVGSPVIALLQEFLRTGQVRFHHDAIQLLAPGAANVHLLLEKA